MTVTRFSPAISRLLDRNGERWTVRRVTTMPGTNEWTAGVALKAYFGCRGRSRGFKGSELTDTILAGDMRVVVDPTSIPTTIPLEGDWVAPGNHSVDGQVEWYRVVSVYVPKVAAQPAAYIMQVRK